ncbi:MAG: VOC family protein [Eubacterium sp.]
MFTLDNESDGILIAMMQLGNMKIELLELPEGKGEMAPAAENTLNHFAVNVDDIEEAVNYIREKGFVF